MDKQARDRFPAWRWWVAVGVVFVVGAVSGPASAEPLRSRWYIGGGLVRSRWYIGGGLGVSGVHDMEERGWNRDTYCYPSACDEPGLSADIAGVAIPGYRWAYDLDLDIGTAFEVAVGRTFNRWRLELAYAHRKNDVDQTFTGTAYLDGGPRVQPSAGNRVVSNGRAKIDDLTTQTLTLNVYYDFLDVFHPKITPYVGVGVGVAFGELSDVHYSTDYQDLADPARDLSFYNSYKQVDIWDTVVVGTFAVGVDYHLTDTLLAGVKLGYSLMDDLEASARYRDHPVHREQPDFRFHEQFSSPHHYSAMFTIKYLFGG